MLWGLLESEGDGMTKLEWALAHTERLDEESTKFVVKHGRVLDESYIRDNHCPHNYGMPDTAGS